MDILYGLHPVAECLKARRRRVAKVWIADKDRIHELRREVGGTFPVLPELASKDFIANKAATAHHHLLTLNHIPQPHYY